MSSAYERLSLDIITNKMAAYMGSLSRRVFRSYANLHRYQTRQVSAKPEAESTKKDINITDSCAKHLAKINEGNQHLRVSVEGGGCSGFQCMFQLDSEQNIKEDDRIFERDGVKVIVDEVSLEYIKGATVDYHEELIRSAFRVINIPMSENGCSCGISFSLKL